MQRLTKKKLMAVLKHMGACAKAKKWVEAQKGSPKEIWNKCENGGFLLWLCENIKYGERSQLWYAARYLPHRYDSFPYSSKSSAYQRAIAKLVRAKVSYKEISRDVREYEIH